MKRSFVPQTLKSGGAYYRVARLNTLSQFFISVLCMFSPANVFHEGKKTHLYAGINCNIISAGIQNMEEPGKVAHNSGNTYTTPWKILD